MRSLDSYVLYDDETPEDVDLFCSTPIRGCKVKVPHELPFSFLFSEKEYRRDLNVKPVFNPKKISKLSFGILELYGNWNYTPCSEDINVSTEQINEMKQFFKDYKILFAGVWECVLDSSVLSDYFRGIISFSELLKEFEFYEDFKDEMDDIEDVEELTEFVRESRLFNMWD